MKVCLFAVASAFVIVGCGPQWQVVSQAAPNPLVGQRMFSLQPIDYTKLVITPSPCAFTGTAMSEAAWLEKTTPKFREEFVEVKAGIDKEFARELTTRARRDGIEVVPAAEAPNAPFVIQPLMPFMKEANFKLIYRMMMRVRLMTSDGHILDEFTMDPTPAAQATGLSCGGRGGRDLWGWGEVFGDIAEDYLNGRVHPK